MPETLLQVEDLKTYFFTEAGVVKAVDGTSFQVNRGEPLGLVGESGSGKTVSALSILGVVPRPGRIVSGKILFHGEDLVGKSDSDMRRIRGRKIGYVSQDPNSSLDPLFTVEYQLAEVIQAHEKIPKEEARQRVLSLLNLVKIPEPEARLRAYPHELSGGMRQRVAIARALAANPDLLIADEPTTNLDVTIQAQVLELLRSLERDLGMTLILITHDMGIVAEMTKRVVVLYAGRVAEVADTRSIYNSPKHPYTHALLASVPRVDRKKTLIPIPGNIPNLISPPSGCRFHPRCSYMVDKCVNEIPPLEPIGDGREVSCHRWKEINLGRGA
ncbi:MAG TPA: ABC transporter ATP-binding protein [Nitrososphaerales archaeon]|nr:ABC transporter ATP-binding protein [Nitrososphaerales archaeon]